MTLTTAKCTKKAYHFGKLDTREIVADFKGGSLTSDADLLLIKQVDELFQITHHFAPFKTAQLGTIRLRLLKVAAQARLSVRRIYVGINSHCPCQQWFENAILRLKRLPAPT